MTILKGGCKGMNLRKVDSHSRGVEALEYTTVSGDTFDLIALNQLGNSNLAGHIIEANLEYAQVLIFGSGTKLFIPEIVESFSSNLPPWKRGNI